jgi:hypothetical protein
MSEPAPGLGSTLAQRLKWARIMRGYTSDRNAATVLRFVLSTYRKHESGERGDGGLKDHHIKRYAKAFKINPVWLQTGQGSWQPSLTLEELSDEERRMIEAYRAAKSA